METVRELVDVGGGRLLEVLLAGPPEGVPLVFHHGTPGAATRSRPMEREAAARGLRMVVAARPGYGDSGRKPGRKVADVVDDTAAVLDHLGVERCLVAGWSGGGPHALACAARLPAAAAVLVIAGVAPYGAGGLDWMAGMGEDNVAEFGAALAGEEKLTAFLTEVSGHLAGATVDGLIRELDSLLPDVDKASLTDEYGEDLVDSIGAALRNGIGGWFDDDIAFTRAWGFDLDEIQIPVALWQGSADLMVPFTHGRWLADHLRGAAVHLEAGEGHLSIGVGAMGRMLDELVALGGIGGT